MDRQRYRRKTTDPVTQRAVRRTCLPVSQELRFDREAAFALASRTVDFVCLQMTATVSVDRLKAQAWRWAAVDFFWRFVYVGGSVSGILLRIGERVSERSNCCFKGLS